MNHTKAVLYGLGIWAITFIVAFALFPIKNNERPLFESIIPVVLTLATTVASYFYLKEIKERFIFIGLCLSIIWLLTSLILDSLFFFWGPMKMSVLDYVKDIAVTYLIIFIIPLGFGYMASFQSKK